MTITLPRPISVNRLYRSTCRGGYSHTYMSKEGRDWIEEAGWELKSQWHKETIKGTVSLYIKLYLCGRKDIDNFFKGLLDLLTHMRVIKDDSLVNFIQIEKVKVLHRNKEKVEIEIIPD